MDFDDHHNGRPMTTDAQRPPQLIARNIVAGYGQIFGGGDIDADSDAHHRQHAQALLRNLVQEHSMVRDDVSISEDDRSSSDGDEGLEDHQREQHIDAADLGYFHVGEMKRLLAHHHLCECPICPHRINASVNEWLMNAAVDPETPGSMFPEQSSGELSLASSMFLEATPQTPAQLLAEMGSWPVENTGIQYRDDHNYVQSPLWLLPERIMPCQLDNCIPEESEPASDNEY